MSRLTQWLDERQDAHRFALLSDFDAALAFPVALKMIRAVLNQKKLNVEQVQAGGTEAVYRSGFNSALDEILAMLEACLPEEKQ